MLHPSMEDEDIAWLKFLCRKQPVRRTARNSKVFERLEQLELAMKTLGGDWTTTPKGTEVCEQLGGPLRKKGPCMSD
jgi:hypothetical protein